ncbi:MAG: glycosyltransferase [Candidatus Thorarchaeota archaeon]|jgi:glycosyltransferase involved in cell wall biosynthesis
MKFSIVIPTYNRLNNIKLVLAALDSQVEPPEFEVIISDDGSTDGTRDFCNAFAINYSFPIIHQWCGPNNGFRTARTRNIGVAQARAGHVILLDSDVLLNPDASREYAIAVDAQPEIVIVGMYHFAPSHSLTPEDVKTDFNKVKNLVPDEKSKGPPVPGIDCRVDGFHDNVISDNIITEYDGLGFFSGNICWPVDLWWLLGGQDEKMPSGMGEDAELGQRMRKLKVPVLQYEPVWGVHLPHKRDVVESQRLVQHSIAYIDRTHGVGTYDAITDPETDPREKDLSVWYTRIQGASIVKLEDNDTVYAVDGMSKHYVGLPDPWWLELLDFDFEKDIQIVEQEFLDARENMGTIRK